MQAEQSGWSGERSETSDSFPPETDFQPCSADLGRRAGALAKRCRESGAESGRGYTFPRRGHPCCFGGTVPKKGGGLGAQRHFLQAPFLVGSLRTPALECGRQKSEKTEKASAKAIATGAKIAINSFVTN